jgi:predicted GIY-YIG superfamily endonuclease
MTGSEGCPPKPYSAKEGSMYYVYLLQSIPYPDQRYVGFTEDLRTRMTTHNNGGSPHTSKYRPWKLITYVAFSNKAGALAFERYLKSGSGHAFANKRLW